MYKSSVCRTFIGERFGPMNAQRPRVSNQAINSNQSIPSFGKNMATLMVYGFGWTCQGISKLILAGDSLRTSRTNQPDGSIDPYTSWPFGALCARIQAGLWPSLPCDPA